jgi:hypothetical protein
MTRKPSIPRPACKARVIEDDGAGHPFIYVEVRFSDGRELGSWRMSAYQPASGHPWRVHSPHLVPSTTLEPKGCEARLRLATELRGWADWLERETPRAVATYHPAEGPA